MTFLGPDRPGLVESVANAVANRDGNWVESRMAHLAGQFAGIVRIEVEQTRADELREALRSLDLAVTIQEDAEFEAKSEAKQTVVLELLGQDRPGIVREVSHALVSNGINVEELETECSSAPWSGERLFKATARLGIPESSSIDQLRDDLETVANQLTLEIDLIERSSTKSP